jgi:4-amino-4-deoxy-L-arabinose transferase-like glycosyltransferase
VVAAVAVVVASFWWVVVVDLIPTGLRPYIGGSTTDSAFDLVFGYDGLGRIFGLGGEPGGGAGGGGFSGEAGLLRLFNTEFGGQISWLIPFALVALATGLWLRRRVTRTDLGLAGYVLWGAWFAVHAVVFSFMSGIVHTYYAVAMAPAVAALVGAGVVDLWRLRDRTRFGGLLLAGAMLVSAGWAWQLLDRTPDFLPGLGIGIVVVGASVAAVLAFPSALVGRRSSLAAAGMAMAVLLAGPLAYGLDTMASAHSGGDPAAGPSVAGTGGRGGRPFDGGQAFAAGPGVGSSSAGGPSFVGGGARPAGGPGVDQAVLDYLVANRGDATWLVAAVSSGTAGSIELSTGTPVMAMGGFNGATRPRPLPSSRRTSPPASSGSSCSTEVARAASAVDPGTVRAWAASGTPG